MDLMLLLKDLMRRVSLTLKKCRRSCVSSRVRVARMMITVTTGVTRASARRHCPLCHCRSSHSCLSPEVSACKLGNLALHHDQNNNSSVIERCRGDLGCPFHLLASLELVAASPQVLYRSIQILTLRSIRNLLYSLDGCYLVWHHNCDIGDLLSVLDL